jgi:hypothetical protein
MITSDGERVKPSLAVTRHGDRARVTFLGGRPGTSPIRKQLEGTIVESFRDDRLTVDLDERTKSIHVSRIQRVVMLP